MASKKKIEYGFLSAMVGPMDGKEVISKASFFNRLEAEYPSGDGWEVYETNMTTRTVSVGTDTYTYPYVTYHVRKVLG